MNLILDLEKFEKWKKSISFGSQAVLSRLKISSLNHSECKFQQFRFKKIFRIPSLFSQFIKIVFHRIRKEAEDRQIRYAVEEHRRLQGLLETRKQDFDRKFHELTNKLNALTSMEISDIEAKYQQRIDTEDFQTDITQLWSTFISNLQIIYFVAKLVFMWLVLFISFIHFQFSFLYLTCFNNMWHYSWFHVKWGESERLYFAKALAKLNTWLYQAFTLLIARSSGLLMFQKNVSKLKSTASVFTWNRVNCKIFWNWLKCEWGVSFTKNLLFTFHSVKIDTTTDFRNFFTYSSEKYKCAFWFAEKNRKRMRNFEFQISSRPNIKVFRSNKERKFKKQSHKTKRILFFSELQLSEKNVILNFWQTGKKSCQ